MFKIQKFRGPFLPLLFLALGLQAFASPPDNCTGFKTITMGGWGAPANGNNPASFLAANFNTAFPSGIVLGCTTKLTFTSAAAVKAYLPQGGTAAGYTGSATNPTKGGGVFGGQLLALAINIKMDLTFPTFAASATNLKDLKIAGGIFEGWTVQQFFDEANKKIGGCSAVNQTFAAYSSAAAAINENFDNGTVNNGFLVCPGNNIPPFEVIWAKVDVKCKGNANGTITLTPNGGVAPYSYLWADGPITKDRTGLAAGNYSVTVKDAVGTTKTLNFTIEEPELLTGSTVGSTLNCFGDCNGTIDLTPNGGTAPYSYAWTGGSTSEDRTGLCAGTYNVCITDANGCKANTSGTVSGPDKLTAGAVGSDAKCYGESTGSVNLTVSGGTTPYSFSWNNGSTDEDLTDVAAGSYNVTVTDKNGCTTTASATVGQPVSGLSASTEGGVVDASCYGAANGSVDLTVSGGTIPYSFAWSNGSTDEDLGGLVAGTYNVTVTDKNGCTTTASGTVGQPDSLSVTMTITPSTGCPCNGSIKAVASGGTPGYTYYWNNGVSGSNEWTDLCAETGLIYVIVRDSKGCTKQVNFHYEGKKEGCTATEVVSATQGLRQDFTPVDAARSNPATMKGAPQNTDILGTFYALGFGGTATLKIDGGITNKYGNDLKVVEVTWHTWDCERYTEKALIEVSQDNITWYNKGIICQDEEIDIDPLPCISYVRITDKSDRADFVTEIPLADGFDVDGIICLQPGNGRKAVNNQSTEQSSPLVYEKTVNMYPNPADNQLFVNIAGAGEGELINLSIIDHMGREVKSMNITAIGVNHREEVKMTDLKPGIYIVRVNGVEMNFSKKIVKK